MEEYKSISRAEQKEEDTWDLSAIYENEELFSEDAVRLEGLMGKFADLQGTLKQGSEKLLETLRLYEQMGQIYEKLNVYANQRYHEDTTNAKYQQMSGEVQIIGANFSRACAWLEPEILEIPREQVEQYLQEPSLEKYRRFTEQITRQREHVLDAAGEELLARVYELGQSPSNIFSMFNNADIRFPEITDGTGKKRELTLGTFVACEESRDRVLRKNAFEALYSVYEQFENTLAATWYANAKQADFFAKERHYPGAMANALEDSAIPPEVYTNLIEAMHSHLPAMHRYVRLRKRLLGLDELHMYDVYTPIVERPEKKYSFEEAKEIVKRGLAPLGEDYQALLQEGFDNRWIDVYENLGKRTGAYSWGAYGSHPYVLLNYHGSLDNVFTLAHEMGHSLHSYYSDAAQPYLYAGYRIFVAEVASTCNEALLIHDLLGRCTDVKERKYLLNHFLEQFKGTMYRQTMFAEFEMLAHQVVTQGGTLTAKTLNGIYGNLNEKYFGRDMVSDPQISREWVRIPHFYTPFYVYQYATGFAAAIAISSKILSGEPGIVEKYKKFLSGGCSMDPIDLLKICDVDMSSPEPVNAALEVFETYLAELEELTRQDSSDSMDKTRA